MPVIVLAGEEEFEIGRRLETIKSDLLDPALTSFNFSIISNPSLKEVIDAAAAIPFIGAVGASGKGNKIIVIEGGDFFSKTQKSSVPKQDQPAQILRQLDNALAKVLPNTYLVFVSLKKFDASLKVSKIVSKYAKIENFPAKKFFVGGKNEQLLHWCQQEAKRYGAEIDDNAIAYLAESTEANLRQISAEIAKAATFILPEKRIALDVVSVLSPSCANVFALLDYWAYGEREKLLSSLQDLLCRQSSLPIMALLHTTLSKWILIKVTSTQFISSYLPNKDQEGRNKRPTLSELVKMLASELNLNAWTLEIDLKRLQQFTLEHLIAKKQQLLKLEFLVKSGQMPEVHALPIFFTT